MTRPVFTWPVYGFSHSGLRETIATFFESSDAERMVMHPAEVGFEKRNLYCAEPRYDRRKGGYRPAIAPARYVLTDRVVERTASGRRAA